MAFRRNDRYKEEEKVFDVESWKPLTEIGRMVKAKEITSIEQIFHMGKRIEEREIVDALLPEIKTEVIEIMNVQRMTKNNRKAKYRVIAIAGDKRGHIGIGAGKDVEIKAAIDNAMNDAKKNITPVIFGCGSWQCQCGTTHSLPVIVKGKCGSVEVLLKPGPRGLGVVANKPIKKMLELAGLKDIWSFSKGRTRSRYNTLVAAYRAITSINSMKNTTIMKIKA